MSDMTTTTEKPISTPEQIHEACANVRLWISRHHLCLDATIDDYPIGRRDRGKCRLQVERAKGKGFRTIKTTTNKHGRWCAPKKSTYRDEVTVVVDDLEGEHKVGWLSVGASYGGVWVSMPAGSGGIVLYQPEVTYVRRKEERVVWETTTLGIDRSGLHATSPVKSEEHVYAADSPERIAAYDAWIEECQVLRQMLLDVWSASVVRS